MNELLNDPYFIISGICLIISSLSLVVMLFYIIKDSKRYDEDVKEIINGKE